VVASAVRSVSEPDSLRVRLGTFDEDAGGRPVLHVWTGSKAPWFAITDGLPELPEV
jgi:hypothetical protein